MRKALTIVATLLAVTITAAPSGATQPSKPKKTYAEIQYLWGYLRAQEILAPRDGSCRAIPLVFDVRNPNVLPFGLDIEIADDFANGYTFTRVMTTGMTAGKNYGRSLKVCGSQWTGPYLTSNAIYPPVSKGRYYIVGTELGMSGAQQRSTSYEFK